MKKAFSGGLTGNVINDLARIDAHSVKYQEFILKALKLRLSSKSVFYYDAGTDRWWMTGFTKDQIEGNQQACLELIDEAILPEK